ncbi:MAG: bifunctional chorismate mutase/prephenate dehydratase [Oscillospiraceae bacterium]|nr:bifunctional chorismate mutase/prephenate dehydratase [Oscillospiraceae bacterium]
MKLEDLRLDIDRVDNELIRLFEERMRIAAQIGEYKQQNSMPVLDPKREREKLRELSGRLPESLREYGYSLYSLIFELSRCSQNRIINKQGEMSSRIIRALEETPKLLPDAPTVACQGVEGAYSQLACERVFKKPDIFFFKSFEAVFTAIEKGLCSYGIIPLENSTAGSVNKVYDLMQKHRFSIVRSTRIKIDHSLLANPGARLEDIKEIYSHQQAISQCGEFLQSLSGVTVIPCENTAVAAKKVAESGRTDVAAIAGRSCVKLYGLKCLREAIQDMGNNYTRFICISKELEIYPGADRTSLMMTLPHTPGSLYKVLSRFYALGLNLNKLESRPLPERNFEFMFYFDLDVPVYSPGFIQLMDELGDISDSFSYLGSYSEVI